MYDIFLIFVFCACSMIGLHLGAVCLSRLTYCCSGFRKVFYLTLMNICLLASLSCSFYALDISFNL